MEWTVVYNDPLVGAVFVPYEWKKNHEYIIYFLGLHKNAELEVSHVATIDGTMLATDTGYIHHSYDCHLLVENSPTKGFRTLPWNGWCPIVKVLERPINIGPLSDTSENWELVGTPNTGIWNYNWEDGYEYYLFTRITKINAGTFRGKDFVGCHRIFAETELADVDLGAKSKRDGVAFHDKVMSRYVQFYRKPGDPKAPDGRRIAMNNSHATMIAMYRRKIIMLKPGVEYPLGTKGWKEIYRNMPGGVKVGKAAFNFPLDAEIIVAHSDPDGVNEMATPIYYTDKSLLENRNMQNKWRWNGALVNIVSSSSHLWLRMDWVGNTGYKHVTAHGESNVYMSKAYQRVTSNLPSELPEPDPEPNIPCEDRCYIIDTIWQQTARVELYFINPPDWANREYEYTWGGDLGNGDIELVSVEEGGRIAIIRLVKTLVIEDNDSTLDFNIECEVIDVEYRQLGVSDIAQAKITFELPCVTDRNNPDISIEDISIVEQNENRNIPIRISLSEAYRGAEPLCVDWRTRDGTAVSDIRVQAIAFDTSLPKPLPFSTVIENSTRRVYIDGAFPKWYNDLYGQIANPIHANTLQFTRNLHAWLKNTRTKNKFLLLGDFAGGNYNVVDYIGSGFRLWWERIATDTNSVMDTEIVPNIKGRADLREFLDQYDCIIYFSSLYTSDEVIPSAMAEIMGDLNKEGLGIACIADHGSNDGLTGFFKGANDFLFPIFGVRMKGSVDRGGMNLQVSSFKPHPLWANMSGRFSAGGSEAYVDATDKDPDYMSDSGTVCFASGEQEKIVEIEIVGDTVQEDEEFFEVVLSKNTWGTIVKDVGRVTIVDDDAAPCGVATASGGSGVTETRHSLGADAGNVSVSYNMYDRTDMMEIFYNGILVATTGGLVSGKGTLTFSYPGPSQTNASFCLVRMTGNNSSTGWDYILNCPVPVVPPVGGGGSGGGCLVYGTLISMADGTFKKVEDIISGDLVRSLNIIGSPDSSNPKSYLNWSDELLEVHFTESLVVNNKLDSYTEYLNIYCEDIELPIRITFEHPVLVKTDNVWKWLHAENIKVGDILLHEVHGELKIKSIDNIIETVNTANLDVEEIDNYFANGILVHNNENQKQ